MERMRASCGGLQLLEQDHGIPTVGLCLLHKLAKSVFQFTLMLIEGLVYTYFSTESYVI